MDIDKIKRIRNYQMQQAEGKRWCYDCKNFYYSYMCGYNACCCEKYGSLDVDQNERHPDKTATTCSNYKRSNQPYWFIRDLTVEEAYQLKLIDLKD